MLLPDAEWCVSYDLKFPSHRPKNTEDVKEVYILKPCIYFLGTELCACGPLLVELEGAFRLTQVSLLVIEIQ